MELFINQVFQFEVFINNKLGLYNFLNVAPILDILLKFFVAQSNYNRHRIFKS